MFNSLYYELPNILKLSHFRLLPNENEHNPLVVMGKHGYLKI